MTGSATTDAAEDLTVTGNSRPPAGDSRPVVLFDGACPMCGREIAHYRRLRNSGRIDWVDISSEKRLRERFGIIPADAMARFHVRDGAGRWHVGASGFVELWSHLPGYRLPAAIVSRLKLVGPMDWVYQRFAAWRLRRRCRNDGCGLSEPTVARDPGSAKTQPSNNDVYPC